MNNYFLDTYASMALFQKSPSYESYRKTGVVHCVFNTAELAWIFARRNQGIIEDIVKRAGTKETPVTPRDLAQAAQLRLTNKNLSMTDAIGYCIAKRLGIKFLTGDKEFENMTNVEFVK